MLIDFHIHAFAGKIAEQTMKKLTGTLERSDMPSKKSCTDGTVPDTVRKLKEDGVGAGVVLNIATKPSQHEVVNNFAVSISSDILYAFGSVFPLPNENNPAENIEKELKRIKSLGFKGVKIHPDYQGYYFSDKALGPFFELCSGMGLFVVTHAGVDALCPADVHCSPSMIRGVLDDFPKLRLIAAHLGGHLMWDSVCELLAGRDLFLDTSYIIHSLDKPLAERIIKRHGAERVLFGSDCPWASPAETFVYVDSLNLSSAEKDLIYHKNALGILR